MRLYHRAVVIAQEAPLRGLVRQLSIDQLDNEGRRVSVMPGERTPLMQRSVSTPVSGNDVLLASFFASSAFFGICFLPYVSQLLASIVHGSLQRTGRTRVSCPCTYMRDVY